MKKVLSRRFSLVLIVAGFLLIGFTFLSNVLAAVSHEAYFAVQVKDKKGNKISGAKVQAAKSGVGIKMKDFGEGFYRSKNKITVFKGDRIDVLIEKSDCTDYSHTFNIGTTNMSDSIILKYATMECKKDSSSGGGTGTDSGDAPAGSDSGTPGDTPSGTDSSADTGSKITPTAPDPNVPKPTFKSIIFTDCSNKSKPLGCWTAKLFEFATVAAGSAAVVAIMIGGVLYTTSGGNPERIGLGKKIIFNALMGVILLILANWFMISVLGVKKWGL